MWLKLTGSLLIIVAGMVLGFSMSRHFVLRPQQVRQLIICLAALKSFINYAAMPLPEALLECVQGVDGPIQRLFTVTSELLVKKGWLTPKEAFQEARTNVTNDLALEEPEWQALIALGANLGSMGREEQDIQLKMIGKHLEKIEQEAIVLRERNVKLYRYLGVCGSLAVVILLL